METVSKFSLNWFLILLLFFALIFWGVMMPPQIIVFFIGGIILLLFAAFSLFKPIVLVYFIILSSAFAGILEIFDSFNLGTTELSISGIRWILTGGIILVIMTIASSKVRLLKQHIPFLLFAIWVTFRWGISSHNANGLKDILFYSLPSLIWIYTIFVLVLSKNKELLFKKLETLLLYCALVPLFLYVILIPIGLIHLSKNGPDGLFGPRAVTTFLLIILSLSLANWKYAVSRKQKRLGIFISLVTFSLILFTLSRMTTITGLVLIALFRLKSPKFTKVFIGGTLGMVLAGLILLGIPSFRERLFFSTPRNINEVFSSFDTQGRGNYWTVTYAHAIQSPWIGWGPGTARILIANTYYQGRFSEYHPHNEYLQVFHDTGIIGLLLVLSAWIPIQLSYWKKWLVADLSKNLMLAKWNMAATLSILVVLMNSLVDNTLHYTFVLGPVFIIVSCANVLNLEKNEKQPEKRHANSK